MEFIFEKLNYVFNITPYMKLILLVTSVVLIVIGGALIDSYRTGRKVFGYIIGLISVILVIAIVFEKAYDTVILITTEKLNLRSFLQTVETLALIVMLVSGFLMRLFKETAMHTPFVTIFTISSIISVFLLIVEVCIEYGIIATDSINLLMNFIR